MTKLYEDELKDVIKGLEDDIVGWKVSYDEACKKIEALKKENDTLVHITINIKTKQEKDIELLRMATKGALAWLQKAPFDYSNGNTDSTGTIDEGNVYGWQGHGRIIDLLKKALEDS